MMIMTMDLPPVTIERHVVVDVVFLYLYAIPVVPMYDVGVNNDHQRKNSILSVLMVEEVIMIHHVVLTPTKKWIFIVVSPERYVLMMVTLWVILRLQDINMILLRQR